MLQSHSEKLFKNIFGRHPDRLEFYMFNMTEIGRRITELRKQHNMTQLELADKMNISFQAVSNWERGNSMPDISKLPELSAIFGISIDTLLGEKSDFITAVINNETKEYLEQEDICTEEISDAMPLLKPSQAEEVIEHIDFTKCDDIGEFLPYMDSDDVAEFAKEAAKNGQPIDKFLPFMDEDDITELAQDAAKNGRPLDKFLPFMDSDDVAEFAKDAAKNGQPIDKFLPFMDEDDITELAQDAAKNGRPLDKFLPFMDSDDVAEFAKDAAKNGQSIKKFLPFMDEDDIKEIALKIFMK